MAPRVVPPLLPPKSPTKMSSGGIIQNMKKVINFPIGKAADDYIETTGLRSAPAEDRERAERMLDLLNKRWVRRTLRNYKGSEHAVDAAKAMQAVHQHFRSTSFENIGLLPPPVPSEKELSDETRSEWIIYTKRMLYMLAKDPGSIHLAIQAQILSDARHLKLI